MTCSSENREPAAFFLRLADLVARDFDRLAQARHGYPRPVIDNGPADGHVGSRDAGNATQSGHHCTHTVHAAHSVDVKDRSHVLTR
jgi:hypothetical protein